MTIWNNLVKDEGFTLTRNLCSNNMHIQTICSKALKLLGIHKSCLYKVSFTNSTKNSFLILSSSHPGVWYHTLGPIHWLC